MKKILSSLGSIVLSIGILILGVSFLGGDTVTGYTFATGSVELKIDNESYVTNSEGVLVYSPTTSWQLSTLPGKFFFKFPDIKPGDIGEDTISLHVSTKNVWACMNVKITDTPEGGQSEPEAIVDASSSASSGELQYYINFVFWADDGDNVYEKGEKIFKKGLAGDIFNGKNWVIADAYTNIWSGNKNDPVPAGKVKYIGKAWCFGNLAELPVNQDSLGKTGTNGPLVRGTGFSCQGENVGNALQTDGIKADVTFYVIQSKDNAKFLCEKDKPKLQYCSHGYWKVEQHFDSWSGYSPNQQFSSVFENAFPGKTLLQVLWQGGGGLNRLGRETVGALLNAGSVNFPYTQAQVISMFNATYPGSSYSYDKLTSKFLIPENCPLN